MNLIRDSNFVPASETIAELEQKAAECGDRAASEPEPDSTEFRAKAETYRTWVAKLQSGRWTAWLCLAKAVAPVVSEYATTHMIVGILACFQGVRDILHPSQAVETMAPQVKFSATKPGADRVHYVNEDDVRVVLSRLPTEVWVRLRAVHFNDRSGGYRLLGYVSQGRTEIALCALPPRIALTRAPRSGHTPERFGANRGHKWPVLAVRRFMLYNVFLHELGHLQLVNERTLSQRLKYAREKLAQEFATEWCDRLWSKPFDHPDPVHNPPLPNEIASVLAQD